jgi:hypothetical protein
MDRLRLLDGRSEPRSSVDMGQQRAARGAQGLCEARRSDHWVRSVFAAYSERGDQGVRVLGRGMQ